ncbi:MAG: saccharopine dehydrogenase, partial [Candidatus Marinimicrobia bacterium]|nr:saccharopine dehydrogenase [Candidatus Neomarinimicrobiota bacterium]
GTNVDVLVDLMIRKMSYSAGEKDMIIVHDEIVADIEGMSEMHISSMVVEGIPNGDSAMSRAVSLPAAIASKLILEEKITIKGIQIPTLKEIYEPVLEELAEFGFEFEHRRKQLN